MRSCESCYYESVRDGISSILAPVLLPSFSTPQKCSLVVASACYRALRTDLVWLRPRLVCALRILLIIYFSSGCGLVFLRVPSGLYHMYTYLTTQVFSYLSHSLLAFSLSVRTSQTNMPFLVPAQEKGASLLIFLRQTNQCPRCRESISHGRIVENPDHPNLWNPTLPNRFIAREQFCASR